MDVAVGDDLCTGIDHGHDHEVAAARVDLLARAQGLVDDQGARGRDGWRRWHRHGRGAGGRLRGLALASEQRRVRQGQAGGLGRGALGVTGHVHGHGAQAVRAQQLAHLQQVGQSLVAAQALQVDEQRVVVEEVGLVAVALAELAAQQIEVARLEQQRQQRQVNALEIETGGRLAAEGHGHC